MANVNESNSASRLRETGATAVEYALLIAMIAAVIATIVAVLGTKLVAIFQNTLTWPW